MSFSSIENKKQYATDGIVDTFAFPYPFQQTSDLVVKLKDNTTLLVTTLVEGVDYNVTTVGDTGRFTSGSVVTTSVLASGSTISILRIVDNDQTTANYNPGGDFDEQSTEDAFDKSAMQAQQNSNLAVILKKSGDVAGPLELPDLADFAGKLLQINDAGTGITAVDSASSSDARVNSLFNGAAADDIFATFINLVNGGLIIDGTGTPEGAVVAPVGSIFLRTDGGAGTSLYFKETGAGNTGWVARGTGTFTSPILVTPTIASFVNATHDHADVAGGGGTLTPATVAATGAITESSGERVLTYTNEAQDSTGSLTITSSAQTLETLDLGTVTAGDVFVCQGSVGATKGGTGGKVDIRVQESSGTAAINTITGTTAYLHIVDVGASIGWSLGVGGIFKVTTGGTMVVKITGESDGSDSTSGTALLGVAFLIKQ